MLPGANGSEAGGAGKSRGHGVYLARFVSFPAQESRSLIVTQSLKFAAAVAIGLFLAVSGMAHAAPEEADFWSEATLYRDEWGVPHVYAKTARGLGFAFGYAQAEDHAEPMLLAYRAVTGRLAEVKGESAAASDAFAIRMGHAQLAMAAVEQLDDVTRALCDGFAAGVNAWLAEHIDTAPDWAEGVAPYEILALWHAFATGQSPLDLPDATAPPRAMETGNAWAVAPSHSAEGQTVLVVNPHQYHAGPFLWYEAHLALDDYEVYGATLYGLPVIVMGHNAVLGWGLTPNAADTADVFERPLGGGATRRANDPTFLAESGGGQEALLLEYYSKARPYYVKTETGLDERLEPSHVTETGPIIEQGGLLYLWRIQGYGNFDGLRQLIAMGRAQTLGDFQGALMAQALPPAHLVYGDAMGNIFYSYHAPTGFRQQPDVETAFVRNLSEGQLAWKESLPNAMQDWGWSYVLSVAELPFVVNPETGFVQACDTSPWTVSDTVPYTPDLWPASLFGDSDTYRAQRVRQLLRSGKRSFRDNQSMLYDLVAPAAQEMKAVLLAAAGENPEWVRNSHPDLVEFLEILEDWDNLAEVKAPGMTAFHLWWAMLRARTPELGNDAAAQAALLSGDAGMLEQAVAAAGDAARMMRNEFDRISLPWGDAHRILRGEREEPMPGSVSGGPIFVSGDFTYEQGGWKADYGYGFAMAVQFGNQPSAVSMTPFGASDVPGSPHFDDQLDLMLTRRFKRTRFQANDVMRNATLARGMEVTLYPLGVEAAFRFRANEPMRAALKTLAEAPGFLPPGTAPFSLYVRPQAERPAGAETALGMTFYIPPEFCLDEDLSSLALYRFDPPGAWTPVADQSWNLEQRVVEGTGSVDAVYAVLGPEQAFSRAAPPREGESEGEPAPSPTPAPVAPRPAPEAQSSLVPNLVELLPEQEQTPQEAEEQKLFKFDWANPPKPNEGSGVNTFQQPTGQRQFKFERKDAPEGGEADSPDAPSVIQQPDNAPPPPPGEIAAEGPTGTRQFKFRKKDGETATEAPEAPKRGKVVYGLPPHVLERQQKMQEQQGQQP